MVLWLGTEEVTGLKVAGHVRSLGSSSSGNDAGGQIEYLGRPRAHTGRFSDSTENELGGLGDGRNGVNVCLAGALDTNEREEETEDESEDGLSDIEVEES